MSSLKVISFGIYEDNQNPINHIYKDEEVLYMDGCFGILIHGSLDI